MVEPSSAAGTPVPDDPLPTVPIPRQITARPAARPTGLTAVPEPDGPRGPVIRLTWTGNGTASAAQTWRIQRAIEPGFTTELVEVRSSTPYATYDDVAAVPGITYFYRVRPDGAPVPATWSEPARAVVRLPAPAGLRAAVVAAGPLRVDLTWTGQMSAAGAELQRAVNPTFTAGVSTLAVPGGTSCRDPGPEPGTTYYYRVRGLLRGAPSPWSNVAMVSTPEPPAPPGALVARNSVACVTLTWTAAATSVVARFVLERADDSIFTIGLTVVEVAPTVRRFDDVRVALPSTYHYRIKACNAAGSSPYSATATITTTG